jgi:uncharacterized protein involved in outer membrane biogenesis
MSRLNKIALAAIISLGVLVAAAALCVGLFGKGIMEDQASRALRVKVTIRRAGLSLPFTIGVSGITAGDFFTAREIKASFNPLGLLAGKIVFNKLVLVGPVLSIRQSAEGKLNLPLPGKGAGPAARGKNPVVLLGVSVRQGKIIFTDEKAQPQGLRCAAAFDLDAGLRRFRLAAGILDAQDAPLGGVSAQGGYNLMKKDLQAGLRVKDLQAAYFSPYYGDFLSQRKVLSARLNFSAEAQARSNDLNLDCRLELSDLVYEQQQPSSGQPLSGFDFSGKALDLFLDREGRLKLDFRLQTKLDNPRITQKELKKTILQAAAKNLASQPPEDIAQKIFNIYKEAQDYGKKMKDIFR